MLKNHLSQCIVTVRAKSPERRLLENVAEEETEEEASSATTNGNSSQQTVVESPRRSVDPKRISTLTNDTTASSIDLDVRASALHPNEVETRKLKSIVQYQC
ncbi:unnamed protein product [Toxocara canis]|nr:unnamed protein product [Toxocara canis]